MDVSGKTRLLGVEEMRRVRLGRERGLRTVSGGRMLLVQAQRLWTGREPDVRAMSDALA